MEGLSIAFHETWFPGGGSARSRDHKTVRAAQRPRPPGAVRAGHGTYQLICRVQRRDL
jgi:hypothetical protein